MTVEQFQKLIGALREISSELERKFSEDPKKFDAANAKAHASIAQEIPEPVRATLVGAKTLEILLKDSASENEG